MRNKVRRSGFLADRGRVGRSGRSSPQCIATSSVERPCKSGVEGSDERMEAALKTIASMLFGAVTVVGACFIGAAAATYVLAMPEGQHFANLDAPDLWTSVPKPVDPRSQKFERVAPLVSAAYPITPTAPKPSANLAANSASDGVSSDAAGASLRHEHGDWCVSRYRSYDPASDTIAPTAAKSAPACLHSPLHPWQSRGR
jgi:hypothetical protein